MNDYSLDDFVADLRTVAAGNDDIHDILKRLPPYAIRYAASQDIRRRCNRQATAEQGFGFQLLHEEPDHSLAIGALSWLPGRGTPPHNHGTWAVVVGVDGDEVNVFYQRMDDGARDGHAELRKLQSFLRSKRPGAVRYPAGLHHQIRLPPAFFAGSTGRPAAALSTPAHRRASLSSCAWRSRRAAASRGGAPRARRAAIRSRGGRNSRRARTARRTAGRTRSAWT